MVLTILLVRKSSQESYFREKIKPSQNGKTALSLTDVGRVFLTCQACLLICICLCNIVLPVSCNLVVTCWERAELLALLYVLLRFVTFTYGVLDQAWYLIVSIPDLCFLPYFLRYLRK